MKKCLALTLNYDHPQNGQTQALRALHPDVVEIDYLDVSEKGTNPARANAEFLDAIRNFRPDWVWAQLQETNVIQAEAIEEAKRLLPECIFVHWTGDCRPEVSPYLSSICKATDLTLVSSVGQLPMFEAAGAKIAAYMQIGVDWEEDVLGHPGWEPPFRVPEVVFCGGHYGDRFPGTVQREAVIRALQDADIDVGVVGSGWPADIRTVGGCSVKQQHHVYRRAKVALSINHFNDIERYYSDRHLIAMASGTPVVAWDVPGLYEEFHPDESAAPLFYTAVFPQMFVGYVKSILGNESQAREMGYRARFEIMRNHTWFARFAGLIFELGALRWKSL